VRHADCVIATRLEEAEAVSVGEAWVAGVVQVGGDAATALSGANDLAERYAEPHRRYHRTSHVEAVLADANLLAPAEGLDENERALLDLAVCAHDVVYDARPGDDERASAAWARKRLLAAGVNEEAVKRVEELVLTTLDHEFDAGDRVAAVLSDADLSILAADPDAYVGYVVAVRKEFEAVPDDLWAVGRRHVLDQLLAKGRLFVTDEGWARWEARARDNIRRELAALARFP
jgi:predicted metal-dependent HD superfamily phosphohydrolase